MNRRRMMMLQQASGDWDFDWNYKYGLLSEYLNCRGSGIATEVMTDNGVLLSCGGGNSFIRFDLPVLTNNKAIVEILVAVSNTVANSNGFRLLVSNSEVGCQVFINGVNGDSVKYAQTFSNISLPIQKNVEYLIRMEYDIDNGNKVTVNGEVLYEGKMMSDYYCTVSALYQQEFGSTYIKEVRFKHIA